MKQQKRWTCRSCHREWIFARLTPDGTCPGCGSTDVEKVQFAGLFDIGTDLAVSETAPPLAEPPMPPDLQHLRIVAPPPVPLQAADQQDWPPAWTVA